MAVAETGADDAADDTGADRERPIDRHELGALHLGRQCRPDRGDDDGRGPALFQTQAQASIFVPP